MFPYHPSWRASYGTSENNFKYGKNISASNPSINFMEGSGTVKSRKA